LGVQRHYARWKHHPSVMANETSIAGGQEAIDDSQWPK
jgi:hypothetical protein